MLGKTHVTNSLAIVSTSIAAYAGYTSHKIDKGLLAEPKTFELFGVTLGAPISLIEFSLILVVVAAFTIILFNLGKFKLRLFIFGIMGASLLVLKFLLKAPYAFMIAVLLLLYIIGVLLVDIDSSESTLGRFVPFIGAILPHRLVTHTIWVVLLVGGLGIYFKNIYVLVVLLGYVTHMLQDTPSAQGICWFYPIIGRYKTYASGAVIKEGNRLTPTYNVGGTGEMIILFVSAAMLVLSFGYILFLFL